MKKASKGLFKYNKDIKTFDEAFLRVTEKIGTQKIPNRQLKLVVSLNFADWFLSATAEEWKSCLSLEAKWEGAFWAGLPGMITDPNRMLIYITDGSTKEYLGIEVESMITRTWGLLTKNENIFPVRSYPSGLLLDDTLDNLLNEYGLSFIKSLEDHEQFDENSGNWQSKYPVDLLYNCEDESVFPYQDHSKFYKDDDGFHMERNESGLYTVIDGKVTEDSAYDYSGGLKELVRKKISLGRFLKSRKVCHMCHKGINTDEIFEGLEGEDLCVDCYYELYSPCQHCGETTYAEDIRIAPDDRILCEDCYLDEVATCEECGEVLEDVCDIYVGLESEILCEKHFLELYNTCFDCGETELLEDLKDGICPLCRGDV